MKTFFLLFPFIMSTTLLAEGISYWQVNNVRSNDVLNIREKSDHKSTKVSSIPYNAKCVVNYGCGKDITLDAMANMQEEEIKLFLAQSKENWCYVAYQNKVGWVNKKYLKESSAKCK